MNNIQQIARLLTNSGIRVLGTDGQFIYIEDPSCILRSFETFIEYAWIAIVCITGLLLFGWAISMIRGAKNNIFTNLRNLTLIFGILGAAVPIVNTIWGDDLFARGCRRVSVPIAEINKILDARNDKLKGRNDYDLYEQFDIDDTGPTFTSDERAPHEIPYAEAPLTGAGDVVSISAHVVDTDDIQPTPTASQSGTRAVQVQESGQDVIYINADGTRYKRTGGSRAWLNQNPGNIRYSEFTRQNGAIGQAGGFAVFPDEQTGAAAIGKLLKSKNYINLSIRDAISRYAPAFENNTAAYHRSIEESTGLNLNTPIKNLTDAELASVVGVIRQVEGWRPGTIVRI